jgi:hypothetical protein
MLGLRAIPLKKAELSATLQEDKNKVVTGSLEKMAP